jgi:predicted nicotinamide N-methyase
MMVPYAGIRIPTRGDSMMQERARKRLSRISDTANLRTVIEPGILRRLDLVEEVVALPGRDLRLLKPRDAEALLSDDAFEHEEFLPYWASLWPSARVLAQVVCDRSLAGVRVLELGCGLGVPSIAAALEGAQVLATDWAADAIELVGLNAARNGASLQAARLDWSAPATVVESAPWPLVIAADVLYERRNVDLLLRLLPRLLAHRGEMLLADPGRAVADCFLAAAGERWRIDVVAQEGAVTVRRLRASR